MADVANVVHETTSTTGTGNITVAAEDGRQTFNDAFVTGGSDVFNYFIMNRDAAEWEVGTGHLSDATTLVRDTVIKSSNADALVNFSAGTKDVTNAHDAATVNAYLTDANTKTVTNKSIDATNNTLTNIGQAEFDTDTQDSFDFLLGASLDQPSVTVTSDGVTITLSLEKSGTGDVRYSFSDGIHTHDCTPAATVTLTAGTDAAPTLNYVYIRQSTKALTISTSGFPSAEHAPVAEVLCQSAASLQTEEPHRLQQWSDHVAGNPDNNGHLSHLNYWIRQQHATYQTGVTVTPTITTNGGAEDNIDIATSAGTVLQMHKNTFSAFDTSTGSDVYVVNHNTAAYTIINDLQDADEDTSGNAIANNEYISLVLWGAVNLVDSADKLYLNFPTDFYSNQADAEADAQKYSVFDIPTDFRGVGFLIARLVFRYQTASSGTWTLIKNEDLRGLVPSIAPGGGNAQSTEFGDDVFRIHDDADVSKEAAFQCSGITAATTRTYTFPDASGTLMLNLLEDTTPQLGGMLDVNGNALGDGTDELLTFTETGSAVNQVNITNNSTGNAPAIGPAGDDTNIDFNITTKGTGTLQLNGVDLIAEGTFTPTVTFGGGSTGITYSTQSGYYYRFGEIVIFTTLIILTSKGTSTGNAQIESLPITCKNSQDWVVPIRVNNFSAGTITQVMGNVASNDTVMTLSRYEAGTATALDDTDFANNTVFRGSGCYQSA